MNSTTNPESTNPEFFKTMILYKYLNLCDKSMSSKKKYFGEKNQDL